MKFSDLGLSSELSRAVTDLGYGTPTPPAYIDVKTKKIKSRVLFSQYVNPSELKKGVYFSDIYNKIQAFKYYLEILIF